jgi:hypothetical protein
VFRKRKENEVSKSERDVLDTIKTR